MGDKGGWPWKTQNTEAESRLFGDRFRILYNRHPGILTENEEELLPRYFGFGERRAETFTHIARDRGVTRTAIVFCVRNAIRKLIEAEASIGELPVSELKSGIKELARQRAYAEALRLASDKWVSTGELV